MEVAALQRLAPERQVNLLRWWLQQCGLGPPSTARLGSAMRELLTARADAAPLVRWPGGELRRYRGRLYAMLPLPPLVALPESDATAMTELGPGLGRFGLSAGTAGGLRLPLPSAPVLGRRGGGEDLRPHPARPRKRLKDLCREAGIVPWMRPRLPLVFVGGRLVAVADLWIDAEFAAQPGEPALKPVWEGKPELD
jgi:tRNA(Ile)-lysidine synthase